MASKILLSTTMTWPAPARLAGAFALLGATVDVLAPRRHPVSASQFLNQLHSYHPLQGSSSLETTLEQSDPDLIIPCDDRALRHMLLLATQTSRFERKISRSLGAWRNYGALQSRTAFMAEAAALGLSVPANFKIRNEAELKDGLQHCGLPAVLKSDGSWGGEGVHIVRTYEEARQTFQKIVLAPSRLRSLVRAAKRKDAHFLLHLKEPQAADISLQSFIAGTAATCAFACWQGDVVGALFMDVEASQGATGPARVLRRCISPQMSHTAHVLARHYKLSGLHGLDFMRNQDGCLSLIEINPRATQICHLALGEAQDLPAALLGALRNEPISARPLATRDDVIALYPQSLMQGGSRVAEAYHDLPLEDPALMHALAKLYGLSTAQTG